MVVDDGLAGRLARLEERLDRLERRLEDERAADVRRRRRERWIRLGLLVLVGLVYVFYLQTVTGML